MTQQETVLVTGTSWFIGFHLATRLLNRWHKVVWIDNENDYYDQQLKRDRRSKLEKSQNFSFYSADLQNIESCAQIFLDHRIDRVVNLAAYAGVRYSMQNPFPYIQTNLVGFHNILQLAKDYKVKNFLYASSASVYGKNTPPFDVKDKTENPLSLYAASKKANELIAHSYNNLFWIKTTWLRFFNVYGTWWRPDSALYLFTKNISEGKPINLFNHGKMKRNFTYVDDVVDWIMKALRIESDYEIINLWNPEVVELMYFVERIEHELWKKASINMMPIQPWEIETSMVNINHTKDLLDWREPKIIVDEWVHRFIKWFVDYHNCP